MKSLTHISIGIRNVLITLHTRRLIEWEMAVAEVKARLCGVESSLRTEQALS